MPDRRTNLDCPAGEDLTAHAHGEGDPSQRAALARHLLACAACRAQHDADARVLLELRGLGAQPASAAPERPARNTFDGRRRWLALVPPLAAAVLIGLALLLPNAQRRAAPARERAVAARPSPAALAGHERLATLLGSQADDGHWSAEGTPLGADTTSTTSLVLLALLHEQTSGAGSDALDLAVRAASRWLAARMARPDAALQGLAPAPRAVLLAALARSAVSTGDASLVGPSQILLADLTARLASGPLEPAALPWIDYALAAAEAADLPGARATRRELRAQVPPATLNGRALLTSAAPGAEAGPLDCTPLRSAIEVLRDEPPLRTLALGPVCRPVGRSTLR